MEQKMKSVVVIGSGITGACTAYALQKQGFNVTVVDEHRYAAMGTSYANGGQLSASNAEAWTSWGTVWKGMKWMLKNDAPLLVNPKPSWHKLSWMMEFVAAISRYEDSTVESTRLAIAAREPLYRWAEEENIDFDLKKEGILHFYRDKTGFDGARKVSALLKKGGLDRREVSAEEIRHIEPALQGSFYGGFYTESDATGDIHKFSSGLMAAFERLGGKVLYETSVKRITSDGKRVHVQCATDAGEGRFDLNHHEFDAVVVCAGVGSRDLAHQLGDRLNIYPVKGYAVLVNLVDELSQSAAPNVSLLDEATKLVSSRLGPNRLRVAGTAEFNGNNLDIRADRIAPLIEWVKTCFPDVRTESVEPWAGLRPMLPAMLPKVGPGHIPNVFYNTGHGHLGWTLGPATAVLIAEMMKKYLTNSQ